MHSQKNERIDTFRLDTIGRCEESSWLARVLLLGRNIKFKLDTGTTEATAISLIHFRTLAGLVLPSVNHQGFCMDQEFRSWTQSGSLFVILRIKDIQ